MNSVYKVAVIAVISAWHFLELKALLTFQPQEGKVLCATQLLLLLTSFFRSFCCTSGLGICPATFMKLPTFISIENVFMLIVLRDVLQFSCT